MVLNYIWVAFFVIAFIVALCKLLFMGDTEIFTELVNSTFDSSKTAFEISLGLTGILSLWLGIMKIGENSGMINALSRWLSPVFCRLFPEIPKGHPAMGSIFMNLSANMLGLDNAATPMGLKAMKELQELNPKKDTATNPMIMFLVMNTSGLILIPVSIMMYRSQMGATQPTDIFIPTLITTAISTIVGVTAVSIAQRINLLNKPILILIGCISLFFSGLIYLFTQVSREEMGIYSTLVANIILFTIILLFILWGLWKKINVYDAFIEGAKEGFTTAIRIVPYLVAFLVGIAVFRTSGAMDIIVVDSVAALVPKQEIEGDMGDSHVGLQARLMSQALRKLTPVISKSNCVVIFINQLREKVGVMFGNPETTTGGRALKFYASVRMDVRRIETLKQSGEMVGRL